MTKKKRAQPAPDAALLRECVTYGQAIAAFNAGFEIDTDGDLRTATKLGWPYLDLRKAALERMVKLPAKSIQGIEAKRRAAELILREGFDMRDGDLDKNEVQFLKTFVADVKNYLSKEEEIDEAA